MKNRVLNREKQGYIGKNRKDTESLSANFVKVDICVCCAKNVFLRMFFTPKI